MWFLRGYFLQGTEYRNSYASTINDTEDKCWDNSRFFRNSRFKETFTLLLEDIGDLLVVTGFSTIETYEFYFHESTIH